MTAHAARLQFPGAPTSWRPWVFSIAAALTLAIVMNLIWWSLLSPTARPEDVDFVIPNGTAAAIAEGGLAPFIPTSFSLSEGSSIRVRNEDVVAHEVAGTLVRPGGVAVFEPSSSDQKSFTCSVHPSGYLGLNITKRPPLTSILLPSFLLGAPLGVVCALAVVIGKRLSLEPDEPPPSQP